MYLSIDDVINLMMTSQKLADQLTNLGFNENETIRLKELFRKIWSEVGDCISRMYAGTGALEGKDDKVSDDVII